MWIDFSKKNCFLTQKKNISNYWIYSINKFLYSIYNNDNLIKLTTSGTTGNSKIIWVKKKYMIDRAKSSIKFLNLNLNKQVKALLCLPPDSIASKMLLLRSFIFKWKLFCIPPSINPLKYIEKYHFDITSMVPMQVLYSIKYINNIDIILIGGYATSHFIRKKIANISSKCYEVYGMTETCGYFAFKQINGLNKTNNSYTLCDKNIRISIDIRHCLVIIFSIYKKIIITNDIVYIKSDNIFDFVGRYDNLINSGGIKIIPELVENYIYPFMPKRKRYFISSINDNIFGEKVVLIIEGDKCLIRIPKKIFFDNKKYFKPKKIFFYKKFIENSLGKIKRKNIIKNIIRDIQ